VDVVASLSQGPTAAAQCGLFTHKSVPVIFEPPCICIKLQPVTYIDKSCNNEISLNTTSLVSHACIYFLFIVSKLVHDLKMAKHGRNM